MTVFLSQGVPLDILTAGSPGPDQLRGRLMMVIVMIVVMMIFMKIMRMIIML